MIRTTISSRRSFKSRIVRYYLKISALTRFMSYFRWSINEKALIMIIHLALHSPFPIFMLKFSPNLILHHFQLLLSDIIWWFRVLQVAMLSCMIIPGKFVEGSACCGLVHNPTRYGYTRSINSLLFSLQESLLLHYFYMKSFHVANLPFIFFIRSHDSLILFLRLIKLMFQIHFFVF